MLLKDESERPKGTHKTLKTKATIKCVFFGGFFMFVI